MSNYGIKRHNRGRNHWYEFDPDPEPERGKVAGATTIARAIVDKSGPMAKYNVKLGIDGLRTLHERYPDEPLLTLDTDEIWEFLRRERLSPNHVLQKAGDRGTSVHGILEVCIDADTKPDPSKVHPSDRGYVEAASRFLSKHHLKPEALEQVVGSAEYRYAGTLDFRGELDGKTVLLDWKSSKGTYVEHHIQLGLYELASQEMGYPPTDGQYLVHLKQDGTFSLVGVKADLDQVRAALQWYRALKGLEESTKVKAGIA